MKLIRLIWMQFILNLKNVKLIAMLFVMPLGILFAMNLIISDGGSQNLNILIRTEESNKEVLTELFQDEDINFEIINNLEEGIAQLKENKTEAVYDITGNLRSNIEAGETNLIEYYVLAENQLLNTANQNVTKKIQEMQKDILLKDNNVEKEMISKSLISFEFKGDENFLDKIDMPALMILYFMFLSSSEVAKYLLNLKRNKVLKRLLTTDNSNLRIIATFALSFFFVQVILTTLALLIFHLVNPMEIPVLISTIIAVSLMSLLSIAFSILGIRLFKKEEMLTSFMTLVTVIFFVIGLMGILGEIFALPEILIHLSKLSPFYWANDLIQHQNYLVNSVILILMGGIVLTAGSINLKQFTD